MASYLDGVEALYVLLDGLQAVDAGTGQPLTFNGEPVPPATTYQVLPADVAQLAAGGQVLLAVYRAGWSDDQREVEGHDRIGVDVYGPDLPTVAAVSQGIEDFLVDECHRVDGVGFVDDVRRDARWRRVPVPSDSYQQTQATYRLISRPD